MSDKNTDNKWPSLRPFWGAKHASSDAPPKAELQISAFHHVEDVERDPEPLAIAVGFARQLYLQAMWKRRLYSEFEVETERTTFASDEIFPGNDREVSRFKRKWVQRSRPEVTQKTISELHGLLL